METYKEDEKTTNPEVPNIEKDRPSEYNVPECLSDFLSDNPELIKKGLAGIAFYSKSSKIDQTFFQEEFFKQLNTIFREIDDSLLLIQLFTFLADCSSDTATFYRLCYRYKVHDSIFDFIQSQRVQIPISIIIPIIENFLANITRIFNQVFPSYIKAFLFNISTTCSTSDLEIITNSIKSQFISKRFIPGDHIELVQQILQFFADVYRSEEPKKFWASSLYVLLYSVITRFDGLEEEFSFPADLSEMFLYITSNLAVAPQYIKDVYFQSLCIEDSKILFFLRDIFSNFLNSLDSQLHAMLESENNFSDFEWLIITSIISNIISLESNVDNALNTSELEKVISEFAKNKKQPIIEDFQKYAGTLLIIEDLSMEGSASGILVSSSFMDTFINNFCLDLHFNAKMAFVSWLPDIMMHKPARNVFSDKYGHFIMDEIAPTVQLNSDETGVDISINFISFIIQYYLICSEIDLSAGGRECSDLVGGVVQRIEENSIIDNLVELINDENMTLSFCAFYLDQLVSQYHDQNN